MPIVSNNAFGLAVRNISAFGDTDIFPLPFENHVLFDKEASVVGLLQSMSQNFEERLADSPPVTHSALSPVGYNGYRWATQIDPVWNALYLGTVLSLSEAIEQVRVPVRDNVVFSHRLAVKDGDDLFDRAGWAKFQQSCSENATNHKYVVATDIANFYARIYHHRIENELRYIDKQGERARQITRLLNSFSQNVSYGLPVGGPASRILSELLLNSVDQLLLTQEPSLKFVRYADDYRFFVDDLETAHRVIAVLSEKLQRNEGLSLQRSKTRIMTAAEFISSARPTNSGPGSAEKFLSLHIYYDPYSPTAEDDYVLLREQLDEFDVLELLRTELFKGRIDQALTKKLIQSLKLLPKVVKGQALESLLENIDTLAPVMPQVMRAIRENVSDLAEEEQDTVHARIRELITNGHHVAQVETNLAYMVGVLSQRFSQANVQLLIQLYSQPHGHTSSPSPEIQRQVVLTMGRWQIQYWLRDIKPHYATMHVWVKRAFYVASYSLGDEGKHWRNHNKKSLQGFDHIIAEWASERIAIPGWEIPV